MTGGTIYVRGEVGSLASGVQQMRLKETDSLRLSLILMRAGIKASLEKFQVFKSVGDRN
jgi:glutamate synthase domain-containing protein 3